MSFGWTQGVSPERIPSQKPSSQNPKNIQTLHPSIPLLGGFPVRPPTAGGTTTMDLPPGITSLFPLASLFHPPDNLPSLPPLTPLSPPSTLLSSPSLLPHSPASPPSSTHFYSLHSLLRPELPCPHFSPRSLRPSPTFLPPVSNLLAALPARLPRTFHLFFPTGENAHAIGFVSVKYASLGSSGSPEPWQVTLDDDTGDVFKQTQGFRQACNRICSLAVSPCSGGGIVSDNRGFEGFLLATTLYTVNWFRVETGPVELDCEERQRPFLAPLANYGFDNPVVHACFSCHINEECAVLLQNGELYLFNLCSKQSGRTRVVLKNGHNLGRFISCEYGAEPWTVIVACAKAIVSVDVRYQGDGHTKVLFQPKKLGCYDVNRLEDKKEKFSVFCKSGYSNYHFLVLTKSRLMLLDVRRPCHPVLTWDHGLDNPNYVTMLKLEERKPSDGHEAVPGSGYSILAGSLFSGEFKLFHYGPTHELGASGDSSLFAFGVPSGIFLSGDCSGTSKELMDKIVSGKSTLVKDITWLKKREKIVGFFMIPPEFSRIKSDSIGFTLIRLMSFGRLEVQNYGRSDDIPDNKMWMKEESTSAASCDILTACPDCKREEVPKRHYFLDLRYLNAYVHGDLSEILPMDNRQSCDDALSEDLLALMRDSMNYTPSLSPFIENATLPASIAEVAYKSALNGLKPDLIPLAFAKYSDIFQQVSKGGNFQLLEVSRNSNFGEQRPLIITKPYRRGLKWSKKSKAPRDKLLGPVLPVPVLLTLEERGKNGKCFGFDGDGTIMYQKYTEVHDCIFPANLSADTEESKTKPFFVYEPQCDIIRSKKLKRADNRDCRDGNYETFVCGINSRPSQDQVKPEPDVAGAELFDVGPVRMDFGCSNIEVGKFESDELGKLKGQFSDWLNKFKPYQDFCSSSKIPTFN